VGMQHNIIASCFYDTFWRFIIQFTHGEKFWTRAKWQVFWDSARESSLQAENIINNIKMATESCCQFFS
jgi:hypothetical protein